MVLIILKKVTPLRHFLRIGLMKFNKTPETYILARSIFCDSNFIEILQAKRKITYYLKSYQIERVHISSRLVLLNKGFGWTTAGYNVLFNLNAIVSGLIGSIGMSFIIGK